mgnify:CR=1 FL=1
MQRVSLLTEAFTCDALQPIPVDGPADLLARDRQTEPGLALPMPEPYDRETRIPEPLAAFEDAAVIARLEQPSAAREALPRDCRIPPGRDGFRESVAHALWRAAR